MMRRAVCPGSFDPVTNGHIDVFLRAAALFDEVTVGVLVNNRKTSMFTVEERIVLLGEELASVPNIRIDSFHGLLVDYCREHGISAIVKGLRAITDFDYELQMAQMNHGLAGIETLFITTNPLYSLPVLLVGQGGRDVWWGRQWPDPRRRARRADGQARALMTGGR